MLHGKLMGKRKKGVKGTHKKLNLFFFYSKTSGKLQMFQNFNV